MTTKPTKDETLAKMDAAAVRAEHNLEEGIAGLDEKGLQSFADWWEVWWRTAGHTRLGRILLKYKSS